MRRALRFGWRSQTQTHARRMTTRCALLAPYWTAATARERSQCMARRAGAHCRSAVWSVA